MKVFTEEVLNSIWQAAPEKTLNDDVHLIDVPGYEAFSALREHVSNVEQAITVLEPPTTYSDLNNSISTTNRYIRLRSSPEDVWGSWESTG